MFTIFRGKVICIIYSIISIIVFCFNLKLILTLYFKLAHELQLALILYITHHYHSSSFISSP
jgi:hypothetical protein